MSWGPLIEHDGTGFPKHLMGRMIEVHLLDPPSMDLAGVLVKVAGVAGNNDWVQWGEGEGRSWTLPAHPDFFYVARYRVWYSGEEERLAEAARKAADAFAEMDRVTRKEAQNA